MKKFKFLLTFLVLLIFLVTPLVDAFMLTTHKLIQDKALENPIDSEWYRLCTKNPKICLASMWLTDVSVIFYWSSRSKYSSTHSPSFCRSLLENADTEIELTCAVASCTHQPTDIVSHNKMIPYSIEKSLLVNNIIHVFAEQKLDNYVQKNYPFLKDEANVDLNDYKECVPLFIETLVGDPQYSDMSRAELEDLFDKFIAEVQNSQTGYDTAFKTKSFFVNLKTIPFAILAIYFIFMMGFLLLSTLLIFKLIRGDIRIRMWIGLFIFLPLFILLAYVFIGNLQGSAFNNFIKVIKPISELVPIGNKQAYIDEAVDNTKALLTQGEQWLFDTEASGFTALDKSDRKILVYDYIIMIVLSLALILFIWFLFKKQKT